jgi:hypothetical protein
LSDVAFSSGSSSFFTRDIFVHSLEQQLPARFCRRLIMVTAD